MRLHRPVEQLRSRGSFLLVLCGVALGMGNWWRFAFLLGDNGGAPFMLAYVAALLLLAVPLLAAELALGRIGRRTPPVSLLWVTALSGRSALWAAISALALAAALLLASSALLLGGWALAYAFHGQLGSFAAISLQGAGAFFAELSASPLRGAAWQGIGVLSLLCAAGAGLRRGTAPAMWIAVPLLLVLLAVLVDYAMREGDPGAAGAFLFSRQLLDFDAASVAVAFAQALFTLAVATGVGLSLGAAADGEAPLLRCALAAAVLDTAAGIAIGVVLLALCSAANLLPEPGAGLLFVGLPYAFGQLPQGDAHGALFYFALFVAAMSLALVLLEPLIMVLDRQLRLGRLRAASLALGAAWLLALLALLSLDPAAALPRFLPRLSALAGVLLPAAALLLALFAGWLVPRGLLRRELSREPDFLFALWYFALRFLVPAGVALGGYGLWLLP